MTGREAAAGHAAAVLFDMDGLLVDTEPVWTVAEEELASHYGGEWTADTKALVAGTRLDISVPLMLESFGVHPTSEEVAAAGRYLLDRMVAAYHASVTVMPGALDLVDAIQARGVLTGLVSSSYRVLVDAVLGQLDGLRFDVTLAGDELSAGKPDPECYQRACARLGVEPGRVVVLEDALSGVAAAEAAGCIVVAVPNVGPIEQTPQRPVRSSLAAIDPDWLLGLPAVVGLRVSR